MECFNANQSKFIKTGDKENKTFWPEKEEFNKMLWEIPAIHIAKKLNVSDKSKLGSCVLVSKII